MGLCPPNGTPRLCYSSMRVHAHIHMPICIHVQVGATRDAKEALEWYMKAAAQGDAKAQFAAGVCYEIGQVLDCSSSILHSRPVYVCMHVYTYNILEELRTFLSSFFSIRSQLASARAISFPRPPPPIASVTITHRRTERNIFPVFLRCNSFF